ncbi:hypothetical protein M9458_052935 [Cirrhinus mrigala]|uniref:Uncharacterized protein n=1 Tax=Cirrhinus mrigala TaxID=683832 RepID=A0ABD0MNY8_CIRMR
MMMKLHRYHLDVVFKHGKELFVADALSGAHLFTSDPQLTDDLLEVMTVQMNSGLLYKKMSHANSFLI